MTYGCIGDEEMGMAMNYAEMTRDELIKRLEQMGEEYCQQTDKVEADKYLIADQQELIFNLNMLLDEALKAMTEAATKLGIPDEGPLADEALDLLAVASLEIATVRG